jgi:hypothetical protein
LQLDIEIRLKKAVQAYWNARAKNKEKQIEGGRIDAGTRGEVTGGAQMGAMEVLVADILCDAGLKKLDVRTRTSLELPGYYRAEKEMGSHCRIRGSTRHGDGIQVPGGSLIWP